MDPEIIAAIILGVATLGAAIIGGIRAARRDTSNSSDENDRPEQAQGRAGQAEIPSKRGSVIGWVFLKQPY
jgi:hypothetical protein